jgi:phage terminase small subunit
MATIVAVMALTDLQRKFVIEYPIDCKGDQAAIRAGYAPTNAKNQAYDLLCNPEIMLAVNERLAEIAHAKALTSEWVLDQWRQLATADPTEACYIRVECCRHCWGINFAYQWTEFEYQETLAAAAAHQCGSQCEQPCVKRIPPMAVGGFGYSPHVEPNRECPMCHGDGQTKVVLVDSKNVKGATRRLISGIKQTKQGVEIKFRDQDAALDRIARYLGMLIEKREMSGPNGGPIAIAAFRAQDLSDDQLAQLASGAV